MGVAPEDQCQAFLGRQRFDGYPQPIGLRECGSCATDGEAVHRKPALSRERVFHSAAIRKRLNTNSNLNGDHAQCDLNDQSEDQTAQTRIDYRIEPLAQISKKLHEWEDGLVVPLQAVCCKLYSALAIWRRSSKDRNQNGQCDFPPFPSCKKHRDSKTSRARRGGRAWFNAPVLKTGVGKLTVGSNPTLSAICPFLTGFAASCSLIGLCASAVFGSLASMGTVDGQNVGNALEIGLISVADFPGLNPLLAQGSDLSVPKPFVTEAV